MTSHKSDQFERIGRALWVLWEQFRFWGLLAQGSSRQLQGRWNIATKAKALIKHDRILRGDA
ncbi:hypothetical protein [Pseudomonas chlororaphis]|uniref:hypothetical protein n=1 Tax=Pseudomonas chlororaphis TaxID=587753 RepID=UPI001B30F9FE|nr:hypothetical protein [Pseudomonas chlororaphis]MBP5058496.1 hypothetical protein [Pseudomonas chlororaphis]MBP5140560.1 hypothetical protein [Pseudomonas chlororaphis]QTT99254.1 hypothetical protein HUT26_08220 [Pseudomonas chlororaphis]